MSGDILRFLGKLTLRKLGNYVQVRTSCMISGLSKRPVVWGCPFFVSIEPASVCNLHCPQCPMGRGEVRRGTAFMDDRMYKKIIDQVSDTAMAVNLNFQGEPLMHRSFPEWVEYAGRKGLYTLTSTNGQLLSAELSKRLVDSGLNRVIISVDGTDQRTYERYRRGGNLEKVVSGIRKLRKVRNASGKDLPLIIVQFIVFRHNRHQVTEIRKLGRHWGADRVRIKTAQIEYADETGDWIPGDKRYRRYRQDEKGKWVLKGSPGNRCRRLWETTVITTDVMVVPCCFDKRASFAMGSLTGSEFREIWTGKDYMDFRKNVLRERKRIPICTNCSEGLGRVFV